jgi:glucokinase
MAKPPSARRISMQLDGTTSVRDKDNSPAHFGLAIGVDIGGTKIAFGVISGTGEVVDHQVIPTPSENQAAIVDLIRITAMRLRARHSGIEALGVGAAGWVDWTTGVVHYSPYIAFKELPLRQLLEDGTGLPVVVDNDANMAVWAESQFGAGQNVPNMLLLTLGTGIGGGLIVNGEIYRGSNYHGAEVGHLTVDPGGELCGCGNRGCFETRASGTALGRAARTLMANDPECGLARLADRDEAVTGEAVTRAAQAGDETARELLSEIGHWCGLGAASLVAILDPALIVIAGGMARCGDLLLAPMRASLEEHVFARGQRSLPPIVVSLLGTKAGVIGAGSLAMHVQRA